MRTNTRDIPTVQPTEQDKGLGIFERYLSVCGTNAE